MNVDGEHLMTEPVQDPGDTETEFDCFADLAAKLLTVPRWRAK